MPISLCMIVKNEEKNLGNCLSKITKHINDIVIVDTGSTDKTKNIAKKYTSKVYDFVWCDDFSKARNFSISKASNDWVLILDADEEIIKFDIENILNFIKETPRSVGRIKINNYFEYGNEINIQYERTNRVFNKKYFHYIGTIHEQVMSKDNKPYQTQNVEIFVNHVGYLNSVVKSTNKLDRNITLLKKAVLNNPNDPYQYYQLGKSYFMSKKFSDACINLEKSIELTNDFKLDYVIDLVESYGYALMRCERYKDALYLERFKDIYRIIPSFNFVLGLVYMNNAIFDKAINHFEKCTVQKEGKLEGVTTYKPNYNIGVIYETLSNVHKALEFYKKSEEYEPSKKRINYIIENYLKPKNSPEKIRIEKLINEGDIEYAEELIKVYLDFYKDDTLLCFYGLICMIKKNYEKAENLFLEALKLNENNTDTLFNLGYLHKLKGEKLKAIECFKKLEKSTCEESLIKEINTEIQLLQQE